MLAVKALALLVFASCLVLVRPNPPEYDLTRYCGQTVDVSASAILKVSTYWSAYVACDVFITSVHSSIYNHVRLEILSLSLPCDIAWVHLFDGIGTTTSISQDICNVNWRGRKMFVTSKSVMTLQIRAGYTGGPISAKFLLTAYANWHTPGDFTCDNGEDIDGSLQCDGYNNCGDWSDEEQCTTGITWTTEIYIIAVSCVLCFIISIVVIIILVKRCRRRPYTTMQNVTPVASGILPYGTINGGNDPPSYYQGPPPAYDIVTSPQCDSNRTQYKTFASNSTVSDHTVSLPGGSRDSDHVNPSPGDSRESDHVNPSPGDSRDCGHINPPPGDSSTRN